MSNDRIMMKNPNTGRDDRHIAVAMYEPVRDAILAAVDDEDGIGFSELAEQVELRAPELWADASVMWYTTTVKLHLEATGLIERDGSPQQLSLTDAGRKALAQIEA